MGLKMLCLEESSYNHLSPLLAWILESPEVEQPDVVDLLV